MASGATATAKRVGPRKTANKLARYAGGTESSELLAAAQELEPAGGITAGLASIAAADGQRFIEAPTAVIAPHPYNAPVRSTPQPDNLRWVELINSVRAAGIQVPILVVSRAAFIRSRPGLESALGEHAEYVIIYGHRRRAAAAEAGLATVPAVIDDSVMDDGGDLDAMTIENLGREDLSELQQAEMFARYSEAGVPQRAIAEKLGWNQSTVSRRLGLLLLAPEALEAVEKGAIKSTEAAELASKLPYGPARPWQQEVQPDQDSDERCADQIAACRLVIGGMVPKRAADRVLAERRARRRAAQEGIEVVDPRERFGVNHQQYALASPPEAGGQPVVAAIDERQGGLVYYPASIARTDKNDHHAAAPGRGGGSQRDRQAALRARRAACPRLAASPPPRDKLLPILAAQFASGVTALAASNAGWNLAFEFGAAAGLIAAGFRDAVSYREACATETDLKRQLEITWTSAVAGFELYCSDKSRESWDHVDLLYLDLLQDRASYPPTVWEQDRAKQAADAAKLSWNAP